MSCNITWTMQGPEVVAGGWALHWDGGVCAEHGRLSDVHLRLIAPGGGSEVIIRLQDPSEVRTLSNMLAQIAEWLEVR